MIKIDIEGFKYKATSGDQKIFNTVNIMAVTCIYGMDISQRERTLYSIQKTKHCTGVTKCIYLLYRGKMTKFISK
ncbi:hypothetical protein KUTeg_015190 [Tegillarca granosa]|uniref:Uncharacterized protein n=1 Tax=Tegillarca granosa TaxID=220873 RepID=A0ABQ9ET11_TEGGR|nr:hypothetical protein KUTeg_015190 [Tegillarca granosa]